MPLGAVLGVSDGILDLTIVGLVLGTSDGINVGTFDGDNVLSIGARLGTAEGASQLGSFTSTTKYLKPGSKRVRVGVTVVTLLSSKKYSSPLQAPL